MRRAALVAVLVGAVSTVTIAPTFYPDPDPSAALGLTLVICAHVLIVWTLWRHRLGWWPAVGITALLTSGLVLSVTHMADIPLLADTWWPRTILIATPAYLIISHRHGWVLAAELIALNTVLHALSWQPNPSLPALTMGREVAAETGQFLAYAAIALLAVRVARTAGHDADAAIAASRPSRQAEATRQKESAQGEEADRFVHDEVLHTLRLIALGSSVAPPAVVLKAVAGLKSVLQLQQEAPAAEGLVEELSAQVADLTIAVDVSGSPGLWVPRDVSAALIAAVRECLRNVARHAGVERAEVTVRRSKFALSVTVKDEGRGFDPSRPTSRFGLRRSVLARMAAIGGSARIVSVPGGGTTVHLRWSPLPRESFAPQAIGGGAATGLFPSMGQLLGPSLIQGLWAAALLASLTRAPVLAAAATVVVSAGGGWGIHRGLRQGLTRWESIALGVLAWVGTAISVLLLPADSAHPRLLWLAVTATALASVISIFRPLHEAVVVSVGIMVVTVVLLRQTQPSVPLAPNLPIILAPVITVGIAIAVRRLIDGCAYEIWTQEEHLRDVRSGLVAGDFFRARLDHRLLGSSSALVTLLSDVTAAPATLASEATRVRAERLERSLRDVISLAVEPELDHALSRLTAGGWLVRSRWSDNSPAHVQRVAAQALAALPGRDPQQGEGSQVTLTASERDEAWRLSIVVIPAADWAFQYDPGEGWEVARADDMYATCAVPRRVAP